MDFLNIPYYAKLDLLLLEEKGIEPIDGFPYLWNVKGHILGATEIKKLYRLSLLRAKMYEDEENY